MTTPQTPPTDPTDAPPAEPPADPAPSTEEAAPPPTPDFPMMDRETFIRTYHGGGQPFTVDGRLAAGKAADAARAAMSYIGTPFAWGGKGREGLDSGGLVRMAYRAIGVDLPRLSADQAQAGEIVPLDALQPGDLVAWNAYYRAGTGVPHTAIYVGGGQIVEAPMPGLNVRRRSLDDDDRDAYGVRPLDPRMRRRPPSGGGGSPATTQPWRTL